MRRMAWLVAGVLLAAVAWADEKLNERLLAAVAARQAETARELLAAGANVEARDAMGGTPLSVAVVGNDSAMVEVLLAKGADVNGETAQGQTPLSMALAIRSERLVDRLLKAGAKINYQGRSGETALMWAANSGTRKTVSMLLSRGADPKLRSKANQGVLNHALLNDDKVEAEAIFRLLLQAGAPLDTVSYTGASLIGLAAAAGQGALVEELVKRGLDPWARDREGFNALDYVVRNGPDTDAPMARQLLAMKPPGEVLVRAMHNAVAVGSVEGFLLLQESGVDLHAAPGGKGLLDVAVESGQWVMTRELLRRGVTPKRVSTNTPPLHRAVQQNDLHTARLLLQAGADPNIADAEGRVPLWIALSGENAEIGELLLAGGARRDVKVDGVPLAKALTDQGHGAMVAVLKKNLGKNAPSEYGLMRLDDAALRQRVIGRWRDQNSTDLFWRFNKDGTLVISGFMGDVPGIWSVKDGDLVIEKREPGEEPRGYVRPVMHLTARELVWYNGSPETFERQK